MLSGAQDHGCFGHGRTWRVCRVALLYGNVLGFDFSLCMMQVRGYVIEIDRYACPEMNS